jgi:hypothetical protein
MVGHIKGEKRNHGSLPSLVGINGKIEVDKTKLFAID